MQLFYLPDIPNNAILSKEESFHCLKVLRCKKNELIQLTDGKGNLFSAIIDNENIEACSLRKVKNMPLFLLIVVTNGWKLSSTINQYLRDMIFYWSKLKFEKA